MIKKSKKLLSIIQKNKLLKNVQWVLIIVIVLYTGMVETSCDTNLNINIPDSDSNSSSEKNNKPPARPSTMDRPSTSTRDTGDSSSGRDASSHTDTSSVIEIRTPADLQLLASNPSATFHIKNDIDMSGVSFTPIPSFRGTLDGQQHIIKNLTVVVIPSTESHIGGFINETSGRVTIKNLAFHNFSLDVNKDGVFGFTEGGRIVGGLIGLVQHDTTISNFALKGNISTSYHTGGLVGAVKVVDLIIDTSYVITQITTTRTILTAGLIHQADHRFTIKDTYIAGAHISPATSYVYKMQNAIVSLSTKRSSAVPIFANVYWNIFWKRYSFDTLYRSSDNNISNKSQPIFEDTGFTISEGEVKSLFTPNIYVYSHSARHTDEAMEVQANFKNWDFDDTWVMGNSYRGYPQFQWEVVE